MIIDNSTETKNPQKTDLNNNFKLLSVEKNLKEEILLNSLWSLILYHRHLFHPAHSFSVFGDRCDDVNVLFESSQVFIGSFVVTRWSCEKFAQPTGIQTCGYKSTKILLRGISAKQRSLAVYPFAEINTCTLRWGEVAIHDYLWLYCSKNPFYDHPSLKWNEQSNRSLIFEVQSK